jgi:sarcosine oxidase subunit alpha
MPERASITIFIDGKAVRIAKGTVLSAAMLNAAVPCRTSVLGEPRTALCGMGICFECRAKVDGVAHRRTCQMLCREGMRVENQR